MCIVCQIKQMIADKNEDGYDAGLQVLGKGAMMMHDILVRLNEAQPEFLSDAEKIELDMFGRAFEGNPVPPEEVLKALGMTTLEEIAEGNLPPGAYVVQMGDGANVEQVIRDLFGIDREETKEAQREAKSATKH